MTDIQDESINKIAILIPTRERLQDFTIFANSWKNTTNGNSVVIVRIDNDDKTYEEIKHQYPEFIFEYGERKPFLELLNEIAIKYCNKYNYVGFMEDDCNFNTKNWEINFIKKINEIGDNAIVWADDLINKNNLVGLPFMNSKIIKRLGYMCPPEIKYLWADYFWITLGRSLNSLYYFSDIVIEHRHFTTGKRKVDDVSKIVDSFSEKDYESWKFYLNNNLNDDLKKLKQ